MIAAFGGVVSFVTVVAALPVFVAASVTHTRSVLLPFASDPDAMLVWTLVGVTYTPESTTMPVAQVVPPTRTL